MARPATRSHKERGPLKICSLEKSRHHLGLHISTFARSHRPLGQRRPWHRVDALGLIAFLSPDYIALASATL
jgi:hypothetical protein